MQWDVTIIMEVINGVICLDDNRILFTKLKNHIYNCKNKVKRRKTMKRKLLSLLLVISMVGICVAGCGNKENVSNKEVNPVIETVEENDNTETETVEDNQEPSTISIENNTDTSSNNEADLETTDDGEQKPSEIEESILDEPLPETIDEIKEVMYFIADGQLLFDYSVKVSEAVGKQETSFGVDEYFELLDEFLLDLETNNPELYEAFNNAELPE